MTCVRRVKTTILAMGIVIAILVQTKVSHAEQIETLTVSGGCFWCMEADFEQVSGVKSVVSGYTGGSVENPTYKQVTGGRTGHFEAVEITFDVETVTVSTLLDLFFRSIDPTDAGGQFCDRGESYRSAIFATEDQIPIAVSAKSEAEAALGMTVVTPVLPKSQFYPAEEYHQDFYKQTKLILTRFGPKSKANAYKAYRSACGRDERVRELWGEEAAIAGS